MAIDTGPALERIKQEDVIGQLRRREGRMAELGSENGVVKLDWVEGVVRLLEDDSTYLEDIEKEARELWERGIRYIIWAGMGGSVMTVKVMTALGFCNHSSDRIAIYPLDSTDPAELNTIIRQIAAAKDLTLPALRQQASPRFLHDLLNDVMMVGVSMGMTSEEPITHLTWFTALLEQAQLSPAEHLLVMTLPESYLDQFARKYGTPSRPLQPDGGTGTPGRMSAPSTRVFLLPAALYLTRTSDMPGQLRAMLYLAWQDYQLNLAASSPEIHPYVNLAAAASDASIDGACRMLVELPARWQALLPWIEQLMEESLGKGQKGIVVFRETTQHTQAACFRQPGTLHVRVSRDPNSEKQVFTLYQPSLIDREPQEQLAALASGFLGCQLTMALYGYLQDITFAGQPAVENYKARARALRVMDNPLDAVRDWQATYTAHGLTLLAPAPAQEPAMMSARTPAWIFARALQQASRAPQKECLSYIDLTLNGSFPARVETMLTHYLHTIGNDMLKVPVKLRHAPSDYHSTEQCQMDGPATLISLRVLAREHEAPLLGTYTDTFLKAQAVGTWQAMVAQGRSCFLLLVDGSSEQVPELLRNFFAEVEEEITFFMAS
jgi:hypothetical protein